MYEDMRTRFSELYGENKDFINANHENSLLV